MDAIFSKYQTGLEEMSLADLYREQDRVITVLERCRQAVHKPYGFIGMMGRKLDLLNDAINERAQKLSTQY